VCRRATRSAACSAGSPRASQVALRARSGSGDTRRASVRTPARSATRRAPDRGRVRYDDRSDHSGGTRSTSTAQFFSAAQHDDAGVAIPEHALELRSHGEARWRQHRTEARGSLHRAKRSDPRRKRNRFRRGLKRANPCWERLARSPPREVVHSNPRRPIFTSPPGTELVIDLTPVVRDLDVWSDLQTLGVKVTPCDPRAVEIPGDFVMCDGRPQGTTSRTYCRRSVRERTRASRS